MTAQRFGVVIQGPLVSRNAVTKDPFDCVPNVIRLIRENYDQFDLFLLSTWDGQPAVPFEDPKFLRIYGEDTITGADRTGFPLNNGPRKIVSSHRGVKALHELGAVDFVLVMRTDTYVDLRGFADAIRSYTNRHDAYRRVDQKSFLHFEYMVLTNPYFATDFYLSGHIDDVLRYLQANVTHLDLRFRPKGLIDVDWLIKYMYEHLTKYFDYPEYFNFPVVAKRGQVLPDLPVSYPTGFLAYWNDVTLHAVAPMPSQVPRSLEWRGVALGQNKHYHDRVGLEGWDDVRGRWLEAARERGLANYAYDDGGAPYDHAAWYMLDRYLVAKGSEYSPELRAAITGYQHQAILQSATAAAERAAKAGARQAG